MTLCGCFAQYVFSHSLEVDYIDQRLARQACCNQSTMGKKP